MMVGEFCNREVVICKRDASILEVSKLMRHNHVGDIVVAEFQNGEPVPIGIFTDRDIVVELLAEEVDLEAVTVGDVMSFELLTANEQDDLVDTIKKMRSHGVRRMPVVNERGGLVGILAVDDLIELLSEQLTDLVRLVANQQVREAERRA